MGRSSVSNSNLSKRIVQATHKTLVVAMLTLSCALDKPRTFLQIADFGEVEEDCSRNEKPQPSALRLMIKVMNAAIKAWNALSARYNSTDQWKGSCVALLDDVVHANGQQQVFSGLVNRKGDFVNISTNANDVWGINLRTCYDYCGWDKLQTVFSFQIFSSGATNYLLPWLALTSQLPFETGEHNVIANFMSFCYALGSPIIVTYSLMITILNQHWLRTHFRLLESHGPMRETVKYARQFLQESQQVPLRLSQDDGSLGSLVVLAENKIWWERLSESVQRTRRGVTLSLIAQIIVAIMSWVLTVIAAFLSSLGNPTEALILSGGSLWVWLVPIICGWIMVGTQNDHSTIAHALARDDAAIAGSSMVSMEVNRKGRTRHFSNATSRTLGVENNEQDTISAVYAHSEKGVFEEFDPATGMTMFRKFEKQRGFRVAHSRNKMQPLVRTSVEGGKIRLEEEQVIPSCLGFSVAGDEKQEGPTFNYARMFTWWYVARQVHDAFESTAKNFEARKDLNGVEKPEYEKLRHKDLRGDTLSLLQYCRLATKDGLRIVPKDTAEYPRWGELDAAFWQRNAIAVAMALFVQWGTTGAALTVAYLTEVVGLGCRSGSYVIYGFLATLSFLLLFSSSFLSHAAMLHHQALHVANRAAAEKETQPAPPPSSLKWYRVGAVTTRISGRILVACNTLWLVLISFWELIGFFNNCWCDGVTFSRGNRGFIILFKDAAEMAVAAIPAWAGGVFLSIFVVAASSGTFWLFCRGNRK
ncbi:hypothetical protein SCUP515_01565 [Seiridium cupressi]